MTPNTASGLTALAERIITDNDVSDCEVRMDCATRVMERVWAGNGVGFEAEVELAATLVAEATALCTGGSTCPCRTN